MGFVSFPLPASAPALGSAREGQEILYGPAPPLGELSRSYFGQGGHYGLHLVAYGVLLIAVVLFLPQGAYPYLRRLLVRTRS